jgi:UDP-N-acetylmuramyl pentapeptide synthase
MTHIILSTQAALHTLENFSRSVKKIDRKNRRKIAILGDMAELGNYSEQAHRVIGQIASQVANIIITVGEHSAWIAEEARKKLGSDSVIHVENTDALLLQIHNYLKPKDVVLIKGSQSMRMEKITKALMADPNLAQNLLVRQYGHWLNS